MIEKVGWRNTFMLEAAMVICLLLPAIIFLIRTNPQKMGLLPDRYRHTVADLKASQDYTEDVVDKDWAAIDWTLPKALKSGRFWALLFTSFAAWGISEHILITHHVAFAEDMGYSKFYASSVLALFGVMMAVGSLSAFISDRIGREATFTIGTVIGVAGIITIMLIRDASQPWMLYLYAILCGLGFGNRFTLTLF